MFLLAACGGPDAAPIPDAGEAWLGGDVIAPGCGDVVHLGQGATAPVVAGDSVDSDPTPWQVHLGLTGDPRTSIAITWRTVDERSERTAVIVDGVRHGGVVWRHRDIDDQVVQMHEVHICGLTADTAYGYRIDGDLMQSGTFRTAPDLAADPSAEVVALVFGDVRGGADVLAQLLALADRAATPDLLLFTGDAVGGNGGRQSEWDAFYAAGESLFARVPMVSTIGNHEDGAIIAFSSWALPGDEQWFSLDYGAAHLVVVDDSPWLSPDLDGHGADFLRADLPGAPAGAWKIVMHHQPLYSASLSGHGPTEILRERWLGIFEQHAVDLALSGHDHNYERTLPMEGTTYVVTAGAGAPLYDSGTDVWTAVSASTHHILTLRIRASAIVGQAVDLSGLPIDDFTLTR